MASTFASILSALGRGALGRRQELRQRSDALRMDEENYQRKRSRALAEDQQNYSTNQARKIQEAERLKSLALQDALETELANAALQGGTMDATNMFMQNIPGAPTVSDIGMAAQNKALQASDIKTQTEMAQRDYWKNRALQAANPQSNKKTLSTANNKELMAQIKLKEKELEDAKESYERIKSDIMTGVSSDQRLLESEKQRLARIQNEYRSMLSGKPSSPSVTQQQKDEFKALIERINNL